MRGATVIRFSHIIQRQLHTSSSTFLHENPLGLPKTNIFPIPKSKNGLPLKQMIPGVKNVIMVASGKGGVGKSTVSTNIAIALRHQGLQVGLLDADIYGPSIPKMMNLTGEPRLSNIGLLLPMSNYGVKTMSMGYLIPDDNSAVVWRGLLVQKVIEQLLFDVEWSPLDVLVIDMPPGTGDAQLAITQLLEVTGSVIVSTSQDVALIDAMKCMSMLDKIKIPLLGLVENMSYFVCPNCNHKEHVFGSLGVDAEAQKRGIEVIGSVPLNRQICERSDTGVPITISTDSMDLELARPFELIAKKIKSKLVL